MMFSYSLTGKLSIGLLIVLAMRLMPSSTVLTSFLSPYSSMWKKGLSSFWPPAFLKSSLRFWKTIQAYACALASATRSATS